jgi:hypothetical protein
MLRPAGMALVAILVAAPLFAAPSGRGLLGGKKPGADAAPDGETPAQSETRRRREIDELARQDVAQILRAQFGVDVDWRASSLEKLWEMRLRAAKAAELRTKHGVTVDWRRFSWDQLENMRLGIVRFQQQPRGADGLVPLGSMRATPGREVVGDPDSLIRPTFTGRVEQAGARRSRDADDVIRPTFAARRATVGPRNDPDALLPPTFAPLSRLHIGGARLPADPDALIDIALSARR